MALFALLNTIINIYVNIVILDVIMSWVIMAAPRVGFFYTLKRFLDQLVEPALYPIRRALQPYMRGVPLDFSPIVLIFALYIIQAFIIRLGSSAIPLG
jgi:uncharacterized protein YggT (Ycf19 family)